MKAYLLFLPLLLLSSCASTIETSSRSVALPRGASILLPVYENATSNENAGLALAELTGTALMSRGYSVHQLERPDVLLIDPGAAPNLATYRSLARSKGAQFILLGTVQEYDFKTDLDGSPAVGITLKVIDPSTGAVLHQGSASKVGHFSSSLTSTAQKAVADLLDRMIQSN